MATVTAIWFLLFAALFILAAVGVGASKVQQRRRWRSTRGVVKENTEGLNRRGRTLFTPMVEFTTAEGRRIIFASSVATSWRSYQPGDAVQVTYNPALPDDAEIVSFARLWLTPLTFLVIGFLLGGVAIYVMQQP